jgi:hypothetical protein
MKKILFAFFLIVNASFVFTQDEDSARDQLRDAWVGQGERFYEGLQRLWESQSEEQERRGRLSEKIQIESSFADICNRTGVDNPNKPDGVEISWGLFSNFDPKYKEYFIGFPIDGMPYTKEELAQIIEELVIGIYAYNSEPWLSLEDADHSHLEVVIRPPYRDTLISKTLIKLDYRMKGYLNGGYFSDALTLNWQSAWNRARTSVEKNRILQQYGYYNFHVDPQYRSSADYFIDSIVNEETIKNIIKTGSQIHGILTETGSYRNLYSCTASTDVSYYIKWRNSEESFRRNYPSQFSEVKRCLDSVHSDVKKYMSTDHEMLLEVKKLIVITYLTNFFHTLKNNGLIPLLSDVSQTGKSNSPQYLPKLLTQQPDGRGNYSFSINGGVGTHSVRVIPNQQLITVLNFYNRNISVMNEIMPNTFMEISDVFGNKLNILKIAVMQTKINDNYNWLLLKNMLRLYTFANKATKIILNVASKDYVEADVSFYVEVENYPTGKLIRKSKTRDDDNSLWSIDGWYIVEKVRNDNGDIIEENIEPFVDNHSLTGQDIIKNKSIIRDITSNGADGKRFSHHIELSGNGQFWSPYPSN